MSFDPIVGAILLSAVSGLPSAFMGAGSRRGQRVATSCMAASALLGLFGALSVLFGFSYPGLAAFAPDALSAFFLIPVFLSGALGSVYGLGYWDAREHRDNAHKLQVFWGLLPAGMATLVIARDAPTFLVGWEFMALSAFFLMTTEDGSAEARRAGWVYFIATHIGTLTLFGLFAFWRHLTGSFDFLPLGGAALGEGALTALFFLALLGFGIKAGMMPLHFWLPGAHANAPSHVSALLSGVVLKMGVYGLLRFLSLLPGPPPAWGVGLLALGAISGLLGIIFAIGQRDLKRLLAYSSIENIGIILMGLGMALLGRTMDRPEWIALGMGACLFHVWNHSFFKVLLFMGAGSVVHGAGTRQMDRLGGMSKAMPATSVAFLVGSLAVCALPPFNGFISETILYLALMGGTLTAAVAPALAMIGAIALAAFVKAYGSIFLGEPRSPEAADTDEASPAMLAAMAPYAVLCLALGAAPALAAPALDRATAVWAATAGETAPALAQAMPLDAIGRAAGAIAIALGLCAAFAALIKLTRKNRAGARPGTWDCGYAAPDARMQYTGSSFTQPLATFFAAFLRPRLRGKRVAGFFPRKASMRSTVDDAVLDRTLLPLSHKAERRFRYVRKFQQGLTQQYLLYMFICVLLLLGALIPIKEIIVRVFAR